MSGRRYSGRHYRRRRSPVPGILLLIVAAALVLGALAIFTDVFKKDGPADRADDPAVTQPDDTQKPDDAQQPSGGADGQDGQTGGDTQQPDNSGSQTGSKTLDTITTDATPYQSGGVYIVGDTGFEMYNYVDSLAKNYGEIVTSVADQLSGVSTVYALAVPLSSGPPSAGRTGAGIRVLKDDLHIFAHLLHLLPPKRQDVLSAIEDLSAGRFGQTQKRTSKCAFSTS